MRLMPVALLALLLAPPASADFMATTPFVTDADLDVRVQDALATTTLLVIVKNPSDAAQRASVPVAVPPGAFLSNVSLSQGALTWYAKAMPLARARDAFANASESGENATLVTRRDDGTYEISLSLAPHAEARIVARWEQFLAKHLGTYTYSFAPPGPVSGTWRARVVVSDVRGLTGFDVVEPSTWASMVERGPADARIEAAGVPETWPSALVLRYATAATPLGGILAFDDGPDGNRTFVHILAPDIAAAGGSALPKRIAFVLDTSGSMAGTKMDQMREAFTAILAQLPREDHFALVFFDGDVTSVPLAAVSEDSVARSRAAIDEARADGGTNIHDALMTGLGLVADEAGESVPIVVLLTDGEPTVGVTDPERIREAARAFARQGVALYSLGVGIDVNARLLEALALENGGRYRAISSDVGAAAQLADFYETIDAPLLAAISVDYGAGATDVVPKRFGTVFAGSEVVVAGRVPVGAPIRATVTGRGPSGAFVTVVDAVPLAEDAAVSRAWSALAIADAREQHAVDGLPEHLARIEALGLAAGFATERTGLFIDTTGPAERVPSDARFASWAAEGADVAAYRAVGIGPGSPTASAAEQDAGEPARVPAPGLALVGLALAVAASRRRRGRRSRRP